MMLPLWFRLLQQRERDRGFALTLPFLIGALRTAADDRVRSVSDLTSLLTMMRDETPETHYARISECDRLKQPVVNLMSSYFSPGLGFSALPSPNEGLGALYVQDKYLPEGKHSIDGATQVLWTLIGDAVVEGRFSFVRGAYAAFDAVDRDFISRASINVGDEEL